MANNVPEVALPLIYAQMMAQQEETKKGLFRRNIKVRVPTMKGKKEQQSYEKHLGSLAETYGNTGGGAAGMDAVSKHYEELRKIVPVQHMEALGEAHKKIAEVHQEHFGDTGNLAKQTGVLANGMRAGSNAIQQFGMQLYNLNPAVAAPVMMLGQLTEQAAWLTENLPAAQKMFREFKPDLNQAATSAGDFANTLKDNLQTKMGVAKDAAGDFLQTMGPKLKTMLNQGKVGVGNFISNAGCQH